MKSTEITEVRSRPAVLALLMLAGLVGLFSLVAADGQPALAQSFEGMKGRLTDAEGNPLVGHRAVFRPVEGDETFVSGASDRAGNYVISLPLGGEFVPVAVVTPSGGRIELSADEPPLLVRKGGGRNIQLREGMSTAAADNREVRVVGKITDVEGAVLAGYRIVFKLDDEIFLSEPSRANGEYSIELRERKLFAPWAAIAPNGLRIPLTSEGALQPRTNTRRDFELPTLSSLRFEPAFPGADRLFLSFAEDTAAPAFAHAQSQVEIAQIESRDVMISRLIGAVQLPGLADTELGLDIGYGGYDAEFVSDVSGVTDLDLWAKVNLGSGLDGTEYAAGFVLTVPTGEEAPGLGNDAWATKLFAAGRRTLGKGLVTANLGVRVTGDGTTLGVQRDGEVSFSAAGGWVMPVHTTMNLIVEASVESERYRGDDADFRILGGVNWAVRGMTVRLALAGGLTDAAPDYQFLGGVAIEF